MYLVMLKGCHEKGTAWEAPYKCDLRRPPLWLWLLLLNSLNFQHSFLPSKRGV